MLITRFDPFRDLATLHSRMHRSFADPYLGDTDVTAGAAWSPAVDIFETPEHDLVLKAELPDMAREDIEVTVEQSTLTLKGNKKPSTEVKEDQYRRVERSYGTFNRSFALPSTVDASHVTAEYRNGVLTVKLPFRAEAKPRSIVVDVAA